MPLVAQRHKRRRTGRRKETSSHSKPPVDGGGGAAGGPAETPLGVQEQITLKYIVTTMALDWKHVERRPDRRAGFQESRGCAQAETGEGTERESARRQSIVAFFKTTHRDTKKALTGSVPHYGEGGPFHLRVQRGSGRRPQMRGLNCSCTITLRRLLAREPRSALLEYPVNLPTGAKLQGWAGRGKGRTCL